MFYNHFRKLGTLNHIELMVLSKNRARACITKEITKIIDNLESKKVIGIRKIRNSVHTGRNDGEGWFEYHLRKNADFNDV